MDVNAIELRSWLAYRLRRRAPRLMAMAQGELPLRRSRDVYTPAPSKGQRIPNVVYQTWLGDAFGRSHRRAMKAFRDLNQDYAFEFFDEARIEQYMAEQWADHPIYQVFRKACFGPLRTDIWRYCLIFERGGVYVDVSKSIDVPLRTLIGDESTCMVSWEDKYFPPPASPAAVGRLQHPDRILINWAVIAAPAHPLLRRAIEGIAADYPRFAGQVVENPKLSILDFTGPHHLTRCLHACAEADELEGTIQAGLDFSGACTWHLPGSWVRYTSKSPYEIARNEPIVL